MCECKLCGREFKNLRGLSSHVMQMHGNAEEYYNTYMNNNAQKTCNVCGRPLNFLSLETGYNQYCSHGKEKTCKICNNTFPTTRALAFHITHSHKASLRGYYDKYLKKPEEGICPYCKKETKFLNLTEGYAKTCNRYCSNMYKYGVDNPAKSEVVKKKAKETAMRNHGGFGLASPEIKKRVQQTNIEKYGVKSPFEAESVKEKIKQTNLDRYGAENVFASEYGKQKIRETNLEKFGTESAMQSEEVKQTLRNNIEKRHGGLGWASKSIKEKCENTKKDILNKYCEKNNLVAVVDLNLSYPNGVKQELEYFLYRGYAFIKQEDIKKAKELDAKLIKTAKDYHSKYEAEIHEWLKSIYSGKIYVNIRRIITPLELDFYIPEKNLAIEFNGNFTHSINAGKDPNYHLNKTQLCQDKGIRLIHIFEYEWLTKKDIIKSIISSVLGIYENKIYARECEVREVNSKEARIFLDENHLQGFVASSYRLGLYCNNELVQLLCFGKNRFKKNEVELLRMCTKKNTQVIGGFSKLLKHQPYKSFVSYIDLSKFDANRYLENNFKLISQSSPNYKYINGEQILNRISAQKHKLPKLLGDNFDKSKTESQNMIDAGYWQVYDCGNLKLEYIEYGELE